MHYACRRSPAVSFAATSYNASLAIIQFTDYRNTLAGIIIPHPATLLIFSGCYLLSSTFHIAHARTIPC
ncbi:hypothetical protein D5067_0004955 [Enterobacter huaxiensis]|nr:hypothetical protein D5067_0004955 [Enterobacter huaxiensis]